MNRILRHTFACLALGLVGLSAGCRPPTAPNGSAKPSPNDQTVESSDAAATPSTVESVDPKLTPHTAAVASHAVDLKSVTHSEYLEMIQGMRGSVVVVDMWATWCPPCVREFPNLVALSRKYPEKLRCVSLCLDHQGIDPIDDVRKEVIAFLQKHDATITNLLATEEADVLLEKLSAKSIPVVEVYDTEGKLVKRFDQSSGKDFTYADVEALIATMIP